MHPGNHSPDDVPTPDPGASEDAAEARRLAAVRATGLLGVRPGDRLDRIARRAAKVAGAPVAMVTLVDEHVQWSPGAHGAAAPRELPRGLSFCAAALDSTEPFVVEDASKDLDWADMPFVEGDPHVRFYAGQPIDDGEGNILGSVCVLDVVPREADDELLQALAGLAQWARQELTAGGVEDNGAILGTSLDPPADVLVADADPPPAGLANVGDAQRSSDRLQELERLQALVVSTTAHELRTPLTVLRVHADMLMAAGEDLGPDEQASLAAISRAVSRLEAVSDGLVAELRESADGAEEALRRWLHLEEGSTRIRPGVDE